MKISVLTVKIVANKAVNRAISTQKSDLPFNMNNLSYKLRYLGFA